jgi:hypothetical protein
LDFRMIHIPDSDWKALRKEQEQDSEQKCRQCGWYMKGVCHYSGQFGCELNEVEE